MEIVLNLDFQNYNNNLATLRSPAKSETFSGSH